MIGYKQVSVAEGYLSRRNDGELDYSTSGFVHSWLTQPKRPHAEFEDHALIFIGGIEVLSLDSGLAPAVYEAIIKALPEGAIVQWLTGHRNDREIQAWTLRGGPSQRNVYHIGTWLN